MTKSPFVRIREKNQEIKTLTQHLKDIAQLLSCQPTIKDILPAIVEAQEWKGSYMTAMIENDGLRVKMEDTISNKVNEVTFNVQLENEKLKHEVERLNKILDTKSKEVQKKNNINQKGFWDFLYKVFKIN